MVDSANCIRLAFGENILNDPNIPQEVKTAGLDAFNAFSALNKRTEELKEKFQAIDAKSPDALSQYEKINAEREAINASLDTDPLNVKANELYSKAFDLADLIKDPQKRADFKRILNNQIEYRRDCLIPLGTEAREAKFEEINTAIAAKQAEAEAAPGDPANTDVAENAVNDDETLSSDPGQNQNPDGTVNPGTTTGTAPGDDSTSTSDPLAKPGRRIKNPLANYPIYTYQITLYMITPDAYDQFILSGRTKLENNGIFIIAQSGGTGEKRAPGFELDYYIDDLRITTATSGKDTQSATNTTQIKFKIVEPYGFSFLSNLNRAQRALQEISNKIGYKNLENAARQFYLLGIRFLGFNLDGSPITGKEKLYGMEEFPTSASGQGIFERFYDIVFTDLQFKLDGKAVTYNITAASLPSSTTMGSLKGMIDSGTQVKGTTVLDCLTGTNGLITYLNKYQLDLQKQKKIKIPNRYEIVWQGNSKAKIGGASLVSEAALDKWRWSPSNAETTTQSNDATGKAAPSKEIKPFVFAPETPILQAIETIVKNSQFLEAALKAVYEANKPPTKTGDQVQVKDSNLNVSWYHISAQFTETDWDDQINQFAGKITYIIQPYETPIINNAYSNPGAPYYGPHKRYEYWYTGKNSEVISYEQKINTGYFTIALGTLDQEGASAAGGGGANIPIAPDKSSGQDKSGRLDRGLEAQNAYITNLYDPASFVEATVNIFGDPDFLVPESTTSIAALYNQFYDTDGFTISANGGQVFIEIDFKEAEDYNYKRDKNGIYQKTNNGLLSVNESIQFWRYPKKIIDMQEKNKTPGISFQVITVDSIFNTGKFTQTLKCVVNTFPDVKDETESTSQRESQQGNTTPSTSGPVPGNAPATAAASGQRPAPPASSTAPSTGGSIITANSDNATVASLTGSDDDLSDITVTATRTTPAESSRIEFDGTNWYDENGNILPTDATGKPISG